MIAHRPGIGSYLVRLLLLIGVLTVGATASRNQDTLQVQELTWERLLGQISTTSPEFGHRIEQQTKLWSELQFGEARHREDLESQGDTHRSLQSPVAPTRKCNEFIAELSIADLKVVAQAFVGTIFPTGSPLAAFAPLVLQALASTLKYPIQVQKICSSCQQIQMQYRGEDFLKDNSTHGFATYCGRGKYGANVVTSGLLLMPVDPATGKVFTGKLRSGVFTHATTSGSQNGPSSAFPSNVTAELQVSAAQTAQLVLLIIDIIPGLIGASAGTVLVIPDNIGYGESYEYPKSYLINSLYQQSSMTLWLAARRMLSFTSTPNTACTELDTAVSVNGYSEGGYSAFSACLAFDSLKLEGSKIRILRCQTGGTPFDLDYVISYTLEHLQNKSAHPTAPAVVAFFGNAYSSTDPDLPNTNKGQDALNDAYKTLVQGWLDIPIFSQVIGLVSAAGPLNVVNANFADLYLGNLTSLTPSHSCSGPGLLRADTNFTCQAIVENSFVNALLSADFPTVVCQAPDDRLIPFANIPDFSLNPNVHFYKPSLPQLSPVGNHQGGYVFCTIGSILAFLSPADPTDSLQKMSNLTDPSFCKLSVSHAKRPTKRPRRRPFTPTK